MGEVLKEGLKKVPVFTDVQLEYLEKAFPELTEFNNDPNALYYRQGARSVIKHIEFCIKQSRVHKESP